MFGDMFGLFGTSMKLCPHCIVGEEMLFLCQVDLTSTVLHRDGDKETPEEKDWMCVHCKKADEWPGIPGA